jgi:hypothetical protein
LRICGPPACLSIVDPGALAGHKQALTRQHSHYGGDMPSAATVGGYLPPIQLIRHCLTRCKASRLISLNRRGESSSA